MSKLNGVRVLITRPEQQADKWRVLLEQQGATTLTVPLMAITPLESAAARQQIKNQVMDFDHYRHAIFVSQNAAHYGGEWLLDYWPQWPIDTRFYAVGSATAKALQALDCDVVAASSDSHPASGTVNNPALGTVDNPAVGTMNSEALLALPELQNIAGDKVLIFRGQGGRPLLAKTLTERGAQVEYCELYSRSCPPQAQAKILESDFASGVSVPREQDWVALHSGESLQNWHDLIRAANRPEWLAQPLLIPGARVAEQAQALGFSRWSEASNASDQSMLESLVGAL